MDAALHLARSADPGQILVADTTKQMLPADETVVSWGEPDRTPPVWQVEPLPAVREESR